MNRAWQRCLLCNWLWGNVSDHSDSHKWARVQQRESLDWPWAAVSPYKVSISRYIVRISVVVGRCRPCARIIEGDRCQIAWLFTFFQEPQAISPLALLAEVLPSRNADRLEPRGNQHPCPVIQILNRGKGLCTAWLFWARLCLQGSALPIKPLVQQARDQ